MIKKILILLLLLFASIGVNAQQNYWAPGVAPSSTSFTPTWRVIPGSTDSLGDFTIANGNKSYRILSAVRIKQLYGGSYTAGFGLNLTGTVFKVDTSLIQTIANFFPKGDTRYSRLPNNGLQTVSGFTGIGGTLVRSTAIDISNHDFELRDDRTVSGTHTNLQFDLFPSNTDPFINLHILRDDGTNYNEGIFQLHSDYAQISAGNGYIDLNPTGASYGSSGAHGKLIEMGTDLIIHDDVDNKGAIYPIHYNFAQSPQQIPDREYVDSLATAATVTASNGLTKTGNNIKWQGTLTDLSTTINTNGNDLVIGDATADVAITPGQVVLEGIDPATVLGSLIRVGSDGLTLQGPGQSSVLQFGVDSSASYTSEKHTGIDYININHATFNANTLIPYGLADSLITARGSTQTLQTVTDNGKITTNDITALRYAASGTGGNGYVDLLSQSASPTSTSGHLKIYADSLNRLSWKNSTYRRTLRVTRPSDQTMQAAYRQNTIWADSTDVAIGYLHKTGSLAESVNGYKTFTDTASISKLFIDTATVDTSGIYDQIYRSSTGRIKMLNKNNSGSFYSQLNLGNPVTIACYGTSITYGYNPLGTFPAINGRSELRSAFNPPTMMDSILHIRTGLTNITTINRGLPSGTAQNGYQNWKTASFTNAAFLEYGINEASGMTSAAGYKQALIKFVVKLLNQGTYVIFTASTFHQQPNANGYIRQYKQIQAEVASLLGIPIYDAGKQINYLAQNTFQPSDDTHLSDLGYTAIGEGMAAFILNSTQFKAEGNRVYDMQSGLPKFGSVTNSGAPSVSGWTVALFTTSKNTFAFDLQEPVDVYSSIIRTSATPNSLSWKTGATTILDTVGATATKTKKLFTLYPGHHVINVENITNSNIIRLDYLEFRGVQPVTLTDASVTGVLPVAKGGTNKSSYTTGDILAATAAGVVGVIPDGTAGFALVSAGTGVLPAYGTINVSTGTTGTVPINRGGTNSIATLNNNRIIRTTGGAMVEAAAITATRLLVSDANGTPVAATPTTTEANYLSGVTSAIQTQLNAKAPLASPSFTGTVNMAGLTASSAVATDASSNLVSVTNTGSGNNVLSASPTLTGTAIVASIAATSNMSGSIGASGTAFASGFFGATATNSIQPISSTLNFKNTSAVNQAAFFSATGNFDFGLTPTDKNYRISISTAASAGGLSSVGNIRFSGITAGGATDSVLTKNPTTNILGAIPSAAFAKVGATNTWASGFSQIFNGGISTNNSGIGFGLFSTFSTARSPVYWNDLATGRSIALYPPASLSANQTITYPDASGTVALTSNLAIHGNSTTTGTATTAVTVTIGTTMANTTYNVTITPRDLLTAVNYYISAQTTTTFTVTFVSALTGSINFDYLVTP